ncbi:response regulator [Foetidibacter luteolus]|uniref:response regulator n=1 Tax=Foetidibacter luteolus TaxID=2608880 RepID=UPI00129BDDD0|nr:response regulator [Foetidibacter luteolus]
MQNLTGNVPVVALIIEDEPIQRMVLEKYFRHCGVEAFSASNGHTALCILKEDFGINLVVCDLHMPAMDGFELIEEINELKKSRQQPLQLIIISTEDKNDFYRLVPGNEVYTYLQKPFTPEAIWRFIDVVS